MLSRSRYQTLPLSKYRAHRESGTINQLVQIIYAHTIDSLENDSETFVEFIDNYLSPGNIDKREKASKLLREIVEQTSTDKNELGILDCVEAFCQSVENLIRAYSLGNEALVSEEYEKFQSHFRLLFCRLRFCFLLPSWKYLNLDALNSFELCGGVYLLLDILLLDYYLNIRRFGNVPLKCEQEVVLAVRKYTFYFLFDSYYTRWQHKSNYVLSVQELYSTNRRMWIIFLEMLNAQPAYRFTYLYINQCIICFFQYIHWALCDVTTPGVIHLSEIFHMNMRQTNAVNMLKSFCNTVQDEELFTHSLHFLGQFTSTHYCPEIYHNFNNSMNFLMKSLEVPFDLRPENNRIRIFFRRFCEKVLSRRIFCAARNAYEYTTRETLRLVNCKVLPQIIDPILFHMNYDFGWKSWIGRLIFSTLDYIFSEKARSKNKLFNAIFVLDNILYNINRHPAVLEQLRQEDICAKMVDILSIERTDFMIASCTSIKCLIGFGGEPEKQRLRELGAVEKLQNMMKYSAEREEVYESANIILFYLTN